MKIDVNFRLRPSFLLRDGSPDAVLVGASLTAEGFHFVSVVAETDPEIFPHTVRVEMKPPVGCPDFPGDCPECDSDWAQGQRIAELVGVFEGKRPHYVHDFDVTDVDEAIESSTSERP